MAEAAVEFLLNQLSAVIRDECSLLGGIREYAEDIKNDLSRLRAALRVADEREEIDTQVEAWVKIVRELAYDTEDVLDEFLFRFGGGRTRGGFYTKINNIYTSVKNLRARRRLSVALQNIKDKLNQNSQYQPSLPTSTVHNQQLHGRGDTGIPEESDLVGFKNSKQSLIELLLGAVGDDLRVHSVVGMGGLGKTTMVKKAYDDAQIIKHFQHRVWITVSETFKIEVLLKDVIKQLVKQTNQQLPQDFETIGFIQLKDFVINILSEQRYIIVLDDVWSFDVWSAIKYAFPRQKFGSRIVITTRNSEIGRDACHETQGDVYKLKLLSEKDSLRLFCKKTFLSDSCPPHLVNIAEDIVNKCGGLPLAIVVIAGILATKDKDIAVWKSFQNGLNFQLETNDRMKNLKNLLSLSYYDLPYYLKYCFLYFSIFPEDAIIEKNRVIQLWIAEGFIKEKGQQVKEEVAEAYLNQLIHRNLIQIAEKTIAGRIIGLRVHDILREIILSKALEQNFAVIITRQNKEWSDKCRRLIIHRFDDDILKTTSSKSHIRSLQFYKDAVLVSSSLLKLLSFDYYIPLKVLDLRGTDLEKIPKEVFKLFHLKYLSLRYTGLRNVPKSIQALQNIEILDLKYTNVFKLPVEIGKLHKLQHLIVAHAIFGFYAPFEIGRLLSLQNLSYVQAKKTNGVKVVSEIGNLTQLRKLGVTDLRQKDGKELCSSIEKLTNLISLRLVTAEENEILDIQHSLSTVPLCLRTLKLNGHLERIPQWLSSLVSLNKLELRHSCVLEDPLLLLQDLPMLAHLLLVGSYEGEGLCFKAGKFPKLKCLDIQFLKALKWIMVEEGAMPLLEDLCLRYCKLLEQVPAGIEHLSKLNSIKFIRLNNKVMLTLEPNGENYTKISHIPHIQIAK
ncbi:PREDICTED: disease resistance protein RPM1-like [Ipomoea nil]|uniref:disease resistance protein RPM1-like n=1 Tax=Ipomoea nil TaxID=35883 RepID=UPI000901D92D|nr:PREDICTED: disease resistance protein RPM1-like [Ipomoea nil]